MKITYFLTLAALTLGSGASLAQSTPATAIGEATQTETATVANAPAKITALIKIDEATGSGEQATPGSFVEVHYTGWLYDPKAADRRGTKFDSSRDAGRPFTFQLDARNVIRGWDMGVRGMKVGGKRTLIIPAYLAYGTKGSNGIPPNSALIFDIEMLGIH